VAFISLARSLPVREHGESEAGSGDPHALHPTLSDVAANTPLEEVARLCDQYIETEAAERLVIDFSYSLGVSTPPVQEQATAT
jgi:hypothetical protein